MDTTPTPDNAATASTHDGVDSPDRMYTAAQARTMLTRAGHEPAQVDALLEAAAGGGRWTEFTDANVGSMLDTLAGVHDTTLDPDGFYPRDRALITWIRAYAADEATGMDDDQALALARRTELDHLEHHTDTDQDGDRDAAQAADQDGDEDGDEDGEGLEGVVRGPLTEQDTRRVAWIREYAGDVAGVSDQDALAFADEVEDENHHASLAVAAQGDLLNGWAAYTLLDPATPDHGPVADQAIAEVIAAHADDLQLAWDTDEL